jgi:hypothetical protein
MQAPDIYQDPTLMIHFMIPRDDDFVTRGMSIQTISCRLLAAGDPYDPPTLMTKAPPPFPGQPTWPLVAHLACNKARV